MAGPHSGGISAGGPVLAFGHVQDLGEVKRPAPRPVGDLGAAREAIGEDERLRVGLAHGRQDGTLADPHG